MSSQSTFLVQPDLSKPCPSPVDPAITYTFPLDPFQTHAIAAIHRSENVLVTAKTGSGKTLVAEYAIAHALRAGQRVFYTTPIKSLSNQKFHDLKHLFPTASVGILTGDIKSNPDAQIIVMTTEVLRNLLFKQATATAALGVAGVVSMEGLGLVVFDEVHYINDPDRGHVWEECLVLLPPAIRLVMLSATIDQPAAFAAWIGEMKRVPCWLLATSYRIVPLVHAILRPLPSGTTGHDTSDLVLKRSDEAPFEVEAYRGWLRARNEVAKAGDDWKQTVRDAKRAGESAAGLKGKVKAVSFQHQLNEAVAILKRRDQLPALIFSFSRKECERFADKLAVGNLVTSSEVADIRHILSFHLHPHMGVLETLPQYHQLVALLERGVAFHHSGVLPLLKEAVELLFLRGFVKVLFCTESLAIGLNMPARTVVFTGLEKPAGEGGAFGMRPLRHDEYTQMAGRAGRRGKDVRGYVYYLPSREPAAVEDVREALAGSLTPIQSRIQFHYDFVLKAVHMSSAGSSSCDASSTEGENTTAPLWVHLIEKSYWSVQQAAAVTALRAEIATAAQALSEAAAKITATQREALTAKAALEHAARYTTNAKQKTAKLALRRWEEEHVGPVWKSAANAWSAEQARAASLERLEADLATLTSVRIEDRLEPVLAVLADLGFLTRSSTSLSLTHKGILATEVNEGNPILMTELYLSGLLREATATQIVAALAAFVVDRDAERAVHEDGGDTYMYPIRGLNTFFAEETRRAEACERRHGVTASSESFWSTSPFWPTVVAAWMEGAHAGVLTRDHGIFTGNFMRGLLKVANLLNEWVAMATFCGDLDMLDRLKDTPTQLLRGIAQPESLYLTL